MQVLRLTWRQCVRILFTVCAAVCASVLTNSSNAYATNQFVLSIKGRDKGAVLSSLGLVKIASFGGNRVLAQPAGESKPLRIRQGRLRHLQFLVEADYLNADGSCPERYSSGSRTCFIRSNGSLQQCRQKISESKSAAGVRIYRVSAHFWPSPGAESMAEKRLFACSAAPVVKEEAGPESPAPPAQAAPENTALEEGAPEVAAPAAEVMKAEPAPLAALGAAQPAPISGTAAPAGPLTVSLARVEPAGDIMPGTSVRYKVKLTNNSTSLAGGVQLKMPVPAGLVFDEKTTLTRSNCFDQGPNVLCDPRSISAGDTKIYNLIFRVKNEFPCGNAITAKVGATLAGKTYEGKTADKVACQLRADLEWLSGVLPDPFTVRVRVRSLVDLPLKNVTLTVPIPDNVTIDNQALPDARRLPAGCTFQPKPEYWQKDRVVCGLGTLQPKETKVRDFPFYVKPYTCRTYVGIFADIQLGTGGSIPSSNQLVKQNTCGVAAARFAPFPAGTYYKKDPDEHAYQASWISWDSRGNPSEHGAWQGVETVWKLEEVREARFDVYYTWSESRGSSMPVLIREIVTDYWQSRLQATVQRPSASRWWEGREWRKLGTITVSDGKYIELRLPPIPQTIPITDPIWSESLALVPVETPRTFPPHLNAIVADDGDPFSFTGDALEVRSFRGVPGFRNLSHTSVATHLERNPVWGKWHLGDIEPGIYRVFSSSPKHHLVSSYSIKPYFGLTEGSGGAVKGIPWKFAAPQSSSSFLGNDGAWWYEVGYVDIKKGKDITFVMQAVEELWADGVVLERITPSAPPPPPPPVELIVDNSDNPGPGPGPRGAYREHVLTRSGQGYKSNYALVESDYLGMDGGGWWQLVQIPEGQYDVYATWPAWATFKADWPGYTSIKKADQCRFELRANGQELFNVKIDQAQPPSGAYYRGVRWQKLATVRLNNLREILLRSTNGACIADAIRIAPAAGG